MLDIPYFFTECRDCDARVAFVIRAAEGILPFKTLIEHLYEYRMKIVHEDIEHSLRRLLEANVIERCGEGRMTGYRYITDPTVRYGTSVAVKEQEHVVNRPHRWIDITKIERDARREAQRASGRQSPGRYGRKSEVRVSDPADQQNLAELPSLLAVLKAKPNKLQVGDSTDEIPAESAEPGQKRAHVRREPTNKTIADIVKYVEEHQPKMAILVDWIGGNDRVAAMMVRSAERRGLICRQAPARPWMTAVQYKDHLAAEHMRRQEEERRQKAEKTVAQAVKRAEEQKVRAEARRQRFAEQEAKRQADLAARTKTDEQVLKFIEERGSVTQTELRKFLGTSSMKASNRLSKLQRDGKIDRFSNNKAWMLKERFDLEKALLAQKKAAPPEKKKQEVNAILGVGETLIIRGLKYHHCIRLDPEEIDKIVEERQRLLRKVESLKVA